MENFDIDLAVSHVKCIADNNRCVYCDQLRKPCVRYPCGHSVCGNCIITAEDCFICFSPPTNSTHFYDNPASLRVENALNLVNTFQDLFKLDVYRRQRISDQLKLEKEIFPGCIQAPTKYSNNRRSSNISIKNKENIRPLILPGENTFKSEVSKMDKKTNYVQQWLKKNERSLAESTINLPRKPFTDLNVNGQNNTRIKRPNKITKKNKVLNRKRKHVKTFNSVIKTDSKVTLKSAVNTIQFQCVQNKENKVYEQNKCEKNESGIVIDDDVLVIDDSQTECIDKDNLAWLAVLEGEKIIPSDNIFESSDCNSNCQKAITLKQLTEVRQDHRENQSTICKVPFYKKSLLVEVCNECNNSTKKQKNIQDTTRSKNVTITIDTSSFTTTIKVLHCQENNYGEKNKNSIEVRTEDKIGSVSNINSNLECKQFILPNRGDKSNVQSSKTDIEMPNTVDVDTADNMPTKVTVKDSKHLIIEDSDEDSLFNVQDSFLEVTADVHRSETENDMSVLKQLHEGEYEHRMKHAAREHTPVSTDSSDKENYDPNRAKRQKFEKKCEHKKY